MAMKTIPGSTGISVETAATSLNLEIMQGCLQVGELRGNDAAIEEVLPKAPLSQQTCENTMRLAYQVNQLKERAAQWELSLRSEPISSVDGLVRQLLTTQFNTFTEQFQSLKRKVSYTIDDVSEQALQNARELQPVFEKAVGKYLQTRNHHDAEAALQCKHNLDVFSHRVKDLTMAKNQLSGLEVNRSYYQDPVQERIGKLARLIGSDYFYDSIEKVFFKLDQVAEDGDVAALDDHWGMNKERINELIDDLHYQVGSDQVNYWVWKLSGEKAGENYGQVHRYDDLGILKEAILRTTKSLADKIMKEDAAGLEPEAIYEKLFEIIGEPQVENPMVWMKENACYYTAQLHRAIGEVKFSRREIELFDGFDDFPVQFNFNPTLVPTFDPSFLSSLPTSFEPQKHAYTQIFDELAELDGEEISSDLRGRVENLIAKLSENGLADTINYEIWRLGGEKQGDNWGVVHRYDDPAVLRQALMIAVRLDVHEQFVVKNFADEEDRNEFYALIGHIANTSSSDSVPADLVAYGKEKIVFHLHDLGNAGEEVKAKIEERRLAKARESDAAIGELIEAVISKNPAAKSIADMMGLINQATRFFAPSGAVEECKAQIRERVEAPTFDVALKNQIFLGIWRANNEPLGDSKWGDKHYLDNLETLANVLLNILVEIGLNGEQ
ncbi:MAG: hypothetical protein JSR93_02280 [Verrucomicrobia bacterium]|nr:hypothetical protein [Verrucomicrobiota bacterium]